MKHLLTSILFLSILFITSCGDSYTCDDCIYFTCDVDGEEFRPHCEGNLIFGCSAITAKYSHPHPFLRYIYIYIKNEERDDNIRINSTNVTVENEYYPLFVARRSETSYFGGASGCRQHKVDSMSTSDRLYITELDTINRIIAGEFNFIGFNECTGDPVHITDGKFRLNYTY